MGYTLANYSQAIFWIFIYSACIGGILTLPVFLINWLIKYRFTLGRSYDLLYRRIVFFSGLSLSIYTAVFVVVPMLIIQYVNAIVKNKNIIESNINSYFMLYVICFLLSYIITYFGIAYLMKTFFHRHKHYMVFYSNNKVFGLF